MKDKNNRWRTRQEQPQGEDMQHKVNMCIYILFTDYRTNSYKSPTSARVLYQTVKLT